MLKKVQSISLEILNEDPNLESKENECLKLLVDKKFGDRIEI